ncbi:ankyrin repeat-containing domain protein [Rhypophila decipiens]|uniref:Ankyrin repeat-containing domain protein n=1 Tax=Rhypophila decipiens TaxID=261697 RepID=A0AAN7B799_9PEZI|nr:ankyrin repeat-containing domain protein [Rhypophila decipiens]
MESGPGEAIQNCQRCASEAFAGSTEVQNLFELATRRGDVEGFTQLAASFEQHGWKGYHEAGLNVTDFDNVWDRAKVVLSKGEGAIWTKMAATSRVDAVRCQLLTNAIQCEDIQMVKSILDLSIDMSKDLARDVVTRSGATYVHVAAYSGSAEIMQMLIDRGLSLDVVDARGMTPLHYACRTGTFQVVNMILRAGVKVDARLDKSGSTPLMVLLQFSAWRTCNNPRETIQIMHALVGHGASIHVKDASGHQVIHYAVLSYDLDVLNALQDLGADPAPIANGLITPMHVLTRGYCYSVWSTQLELESEGFRRKQFWDFRVPPHAKQAAVEFILGASPEGSLAAVTEDGDSPLGLAIQKWNWVVAQALHRAGAPFFRNTRQVGGSSSLHMSKSIDHDLDNVSEQGFYEFTRLLLQQGAKPKSQELLPTIAVMVPAQKPHLWTENLSGLEEGSEKFPMRDHAKVIRELISAGVISDHKSTYLRMTGVQLAADRGVDGEFLSALLDGGSDPYSETDQGVDSFHLALVCGKEDNLKILLDYAVADGTSRDHLIANWLQKHDSNYWTSKLEAYMSVLQHADEQIRGPLEAVRTENVELVELLVDWGAYIFDTVSDINAYLSASPSSALYTNEPGAAVINVLHIAVGVNPHPMNLEERAKLSPEIVRLLLNLGLDPNQQTDNTATLGSWDLREAETPLQIMFRKNRFTWDDKFFEVARMLISAGADPNGIADQMSTDDIAKFDGHEDLWEVVRTAGTEGPKNGDDG